MALVSKIFKEQFDNRFRSDNAKFDARALELADETLSVVDIVTRRKPTDENPTAQCEAKMRVEAYDVEFAPEPAAPEPATDEPAVEVQSPRERARQMSVSNNKSDDEREADRIEFLRANQEYAAASERQRVRRNAETQAAFERHKRFRADPANLVRTGERAVRTDDVTYTAGITDDGRAVVKLSVGR